MSKQVQILPFYTKFGFTLAEVLITLAIIGIVAVLTVPNLLQSYKKQVVASKLQKIYSLMNQAILMSEIKNGHKETWANCYEKAEDSLNNTANCKSYYENYILPYIQYLKIKEFQAAGGYNIAIYLNDGTVLVGKNTSDGVDYYFFPNAKDFNSDTFGIYVDGPQSPESLIRKDCGIKYFAFRFAPASQDTRDKFHLNKGFEPYKYELTEVTKETLTNGQYACSKDNQIKIWCTALIQLNNWKIPDDYPFKL